MHRNLILALSLALSCNTASANQDDVRWHGEGAFGLTITSGNNETETLNTSLELNKDNKVWRHKLELTALNVTNEESTTAERYTLGYKTDYKISEKAYFFSAFRYDDDRFSGFDFQSSLTAGYGRRVLEGARSRLDVETGLGYRFAETVEGQTQDQPTGRLYGDYSYDVSDNAVFNQKLLVEPGPDNTFTESTTAFRVGFAEKLALKVAFTARNNSSTPGGRKSTDTLTSVSVVYSF